MLYLLLIGFIVFASILMCFIVLVQNSKGGGLASSFASSNQIMGVRKTTDFIEKMTWGLAIAMVVLSIASSYVLPKVVSNNSVMEQNALQEQTTNPLNTPSGFAAPSASDSETPSATEAPAATDEHSNNDSSEKTE